MYRIICFYCETVISEHDLLGENKDFSGVCKDCARKPFIPKKREKMDYEKAVILAKHAATTEAIE